MRFENEIKIDRPPAELFAFLTDVERVAPCLPGASIDGRDGDDYTGSMKVKVGPITGTYKGTMRFLAEVDGQGHAEAKITTRIEGAGDDASVVRMETDLQMRGRVAQFGRGAMEKISQRMFEEFARNLEREWAGAGIAADADADAPGDAAAADASATPEAAGREQPGASRAPEPRPASADGQALDPMSLFVAPVLKKALPVLVPALIGLGYGYLLGRLRELRR